MKKSVLFSLFMAAAMIVLPHSYADAGFKLPQVKVKVPGTTNAPQTNTPAPANVAKTITGKFIGPNGEPMKRAQAIFALAPVAIEKQDVRWFLKPSHLGIATGHVDDNGNVEVRGEVGKTYDIILWLKGYEPVVLRNITCPANIGTQKSPGVNGTLREIFEDHRR